MRLTAFKKQEIAKAVWDGQIDQIQTADVATKYGVKTGQALKVLQSMVQGSYRTELTPFGSIEDSGAVKISSGLTFTCAFAPDWAEGRKAQQHYVWFTF